MIVCHCHGLSDRAIRDVVRAGARSHREVALACGAGRVCGGCRPTVCGVIDEETGEAAGCADLTPLAAAS